MLYVIVKLFYNGWYCSNQVADAYYRQHEVNAEMMKYIKRKATAAAKVCITICLLQNKLIHQVNSQGLLFDMSF